jgi:hypothetical protein
MIVLLNLGRLLMVLWIGYALLLLFAPQALHRPPDNMSASLQALAAFALGWLMDQAAGLLRRRAAVRAAEAANTGESGSGEG